MAISTYLMKFRTLAAVAVCCTTLASTSFASTVNLSLAPGLTDPSFRGASDTTWFGWAPGSFDVDLLDDVGEFLDNPAPTLGTTTTGVSLNQNTTNDIISGSNNLYTYGFTDTVLELDIPTNGTIGTGFTTIIVQGRTLFGGFSAPPTPGMIAGESPVYVSGANANGAGQFWAKYEIPGNAASYSLDLSILAPSTSIGELEVDTLWSATGYAPDVAIAAPEPGAIAIASLLGLGVVLRRTRRAC